MTIQEDLQALAHDIDLDCEVTEHKILLGTGEVEDYSTFEDGVKIIRAYAAVSLG